MIESVTERESEDKQQIHRVASHLKMKTALSEYLGKTISKSFEAAKFRRFTEI